MARPVFLLRLSDTLLPLVKLLKPLRDFFKETVHEFKKIV
jgi:preprotein translocase subunit SecE